jgi:hypothetical protein
MPFDYPLEKYFKASSVQNSQTVSDLESIANDLLRYCGQLLAERDSLKLDRIEAAITATIEALKLPAMPLEWASQHKSALMGAARYQLEPRRNQDILMNAQILKMILSQAVVLNSLSLEQEIAEAEDLDYEIPTEITLTPDPDGDGWIGQIMSKGAVKSINGRRVPSGCSIRISWGRCFESALADLYAQTESNPEFAEFNGMFTAKSQVTATNPAIKIHVLDLQPDGSDWCAKLGKDLQVGMAGFGYDPAAAICNLLVEIGAPDQGMRLVVFEGKHLALVEPDPAGTKSITRKYSEYLIESLRDKAEAIEYISAVNFGGSPAEIELCLNNCRAAHPGLAGLNCDQAIDFLSAV